MTGIQAALQGRYSNVMMNAFGSPKRVFVRAEGVYLWDADGNKYLDLLAGIAVNSLGYGHPSVIEAISNQLAQLGHISNFFASEPQIRLAERLAGWTGAERTRVFFTNSGTEANETAFKIARLTGRPKIIALTGSFHGRTLGALAVTHSPKYREPFEPLPAGVEFVEHGDIEALRRAVDEKTAAVVLEVIQGENGVVGLPAGYLAQVRQITAEQGALLWIDEVQTGVGRCGQYLLHRAEGVVADIVTVAKGLGAGFPVGACLANGPAADLVQPGQHGTTFGGNPVAAAAGNAVLDALEGGVLTNVEQTSNWLKQQLEDLGHPAIAQVRGQGLLLGIVLQEDIAAQVAEAALGAGFIINAPRPNVLRIAPPLVITPEELTAFVNVLPELLGAHG